MSFAQEPSDQSAVTITVDSRLVLVDVIAEYSKAKLRSRELLTELKQEDFRIYDNGKEMPISSFDVGVTRGTRPIALWLIVQCPHGFPAGWASDVFRGNSHHLKPALTNLQDHDVVGVAHWCDNGTASIDLVPGKNPDSALATLEALLNRKPTSGANRSGELAMQKLIRTIVDQTSATKPDRLPILLFLYGDHSATFINEADRIIAALLETSGIVFGMADNRSRFDREIGAGGQVSYLVHRYSKETGGEFYTTIDPSLFSSALQYILTQVHLRYTIGFKPLSIDGKKHDLKVVLTKEAQKKFRGAELRFRKNYVPVPTRANK